MIECKSKTCSSMQQYKEAGGGAGRGVIMFYKIHQLTLTDCSLMRQHQIASNLTPDGCKLARKIRQAEQTVWVRRSTLITPHHAQSVKHQHRIISQSRFTDSPYTKEPQSTYVVVYSNSYLPQTYSVGKVYLVVLQYDKFTNRRTAAILYLLSNLCTITS